MRFVRGWLPLLLTALLLLLSSSAFGSSHYFCRMAGRVVAECCCTAETDAGCEQGVRTADCCERMSAKPRAVLDRTLRATDGIQAAALAATLEEPAYVAPCSRREARVGHAGRGPPATERLFAVHCALLI